MDLRIHEIKRTTTSIRLREDINDMLKRFCQKNELKKSWVVEELLIQFLEKEGYYERKAQ